MNKSNWSKVKLGDIITLNYGKSLVSSVRTDGKVPVFGSSGITGYHNSPLVNEKGYVVGRKGNVGAIFYSDIPFYPIDTVYYITESESKIDFKFLGYLLNTVNFNVFNGDSVVPGLNRDAAYSHEMLIPVDEEVQKSIAAILSSLDDKIELLREQNKTLENIAQTLFKRWFVDFEFPNEDGKPYKSSGGKMVESEMGEIPKGWVIMGIDQIANFLNGLAMQKYPVVENKEILSVIKIKELNTGVTSDSDKAGYAFDSRYLVENGDILFSWSGSLVLKIWDGGKGALNQHLFKVTSDRYPKWFYYYWIILHLPNFRSIAEGKSTTMGHIQRHHLSDAKVSVPPNEMLNKVNSIFEPIFNKIIINNTQITSLCNARDTLLPKLINGEISINEIDEGSERNLHK